MSHKNDIFEETVSSIRNEATSDEHESAVGERVWQRLSLPVTNAGEGDGALARIEGCEGFQSLIPDYLTGPSSKPRILVFPIK